MHKILHTLSKTACHQGKESQVQHTAHGTCWERQENHWESTITRPTLAYETKMELHFSKHIMLFSCKKIPHIM